MQRTQKQCSWFSVFEGRPIFPEDDETEKLNFGSVPVDLGFQKKIEILEEVQWSEEKPVNVGVRGILLKKIRF